MRIHINPFLNSPLRSYNIENEITNDYVMWNGSFYPIENHNPGIIISSINVGFGNSKSIIFIYNDEYITHFPFFDDLNLVYTENSYLMTSLKLMRVHKGDIWFTLRDTKLFVHMKPEEYMEAMLKI